MKRTLSVERLYFLGDYKNIKIGNTLEVSEEWATDRERLEALTKTMMIDCDMAYQHYKELNEAIKDKRNADERAVDILEALKEERERIVAEAKLEETENK